jgi:aryl-alcohol dehydrogenase-like predicted oxidoreductase
MINMRYVDCDGKQASVLGFGCGAVMGRVGRGDSLRAVGAAWDAGVTLFDTARSYGYGEAEGLLGEFLKGCRDRAVISTKFGIWPRRQNLLKKIAKPMVRTALRVMPSARAVVRRGAAREIVGGQFSVEALRRSLEESLRQLRTDYVDLLFLHEGTISAMRNEDLLAELEVLIRTGKVRRAGISAETEVVLEAIADGPEVLHAMQFAANLFDLRVTDSIYQNPRELFLIGNHPFGGVAGVDQMRLKLAEIAGDTSLPAELREKLKEDERGVLAEIIFGVVLRGTGIHAVVPSMLREQNLQANVAAVESMRFSDAELKLLRNLFAS